MAHAWVSDRARERTVCGQQARTSYKTQLAGQGDNKVASKMSTGEHEKAGVIGQTVQPPMKVG